MTAEFSPFDSTGRLRPVTEAELASLTPERRKVLEKVIGAKKVCDAARADLFEARTAHKDSMKLHDAYLALRRKLFPPQSQIDALRDVIWSSNEMRPWRRGDKRKER